MAEERKHTTLRELLSQKSKIEQEAVSNKHEGFLPTVAQFPKEPEATVEKKNPTPQKKEVERGRILLFTPTKEKVTILREKVGKSYTGDWLHEVTTRDGHKFLAMQKQLTVLVK